MTIRESERALILYTLQATRWRIGGPKGAAERLGLKRTTLMYRLKRLGIERPLRRAALPDDLTPPERPPSAGSSVSIWGECADCFQTFSPPSIRINLDSQTFAVLGSLKMS